MKFWDSSAILPLIVDEPSAPQVMPLVTADRTMVVWWGTWVECCSAIARRHRDGIIDDQQVARSHKLLDMLSAEWVVVEASKPVAITAARLVRTHPLTAADALQLAAAIILPDPGTSHHTEFVCLDKRLVKAAKAEGFTVLPATL